MKITFKNDVAGESFDLSHPGGIPEFLGRLVMESQKPAVTETPFTQARGTAKRSKSRCSGPSRPTRRSAPTSTASAPRLGGTHEKRLQERHLVKAIRNYMATHEVKTKGLDITADDIREGVVGVLSVFVREPMFQGQTKERLNNPEMLSTVEKFVRPGWRAGSTPT